MSRDDLYGIARSGSHVGTPGLRYQQLSYREASNLHLRTPYYSRQPRHGGRTRRCCAEGRHRCSRPVTLYGYKSLSVQQSDVEVGGWHHSSTTGCSR